MEDNNVENGIVNPVVENDGPIVVKTDEGNKDGQNKCPKCGATDISLNVNNGHLRCNFCRHEFDPKKLSDMQENLSELKGEVVGSGTQDIKADTKDVLTLKCTSCGAEVVIDTASATQARCHWCRNTLSINQQIPNGSIPDVVLPFKVTKDQAKEDIEKFVKSRKFFANNTFRREFTTENIMGVYFPYMLVDFNSHVNLVGEGEHQTRSYRINDDTYYDADRYHVEREFDLVIDGLTVESSADKLDKKSSNKTNNVINAIMPFDVENCVKYDSNYIKGYTSERRDTNIEQLKPLVETQSKDIAKFSVNNTLTNYDRGVAWTTQDMNVIGTQWKAAYLPVWLYSYQEKKGDKSVLHYVAVNARTRETMGSVPINMGKLILISILIEIASLFAMVQIDFDYNWIFLSFGIVFFMIMYGKYRNSNARHTYETETKTVVQNLRKEDKFLRKEKRLSNRRIAGANNTSIAGETMGDKLLNSVMKDNIVAQAINTVSNNEKK